MDFMNIVWYVFVGFLPGLFWLWFYYKKDLHPEPLKWIFKVFVWGLLAAIPAVVIELLADSLLLNYLDEASLIYIILSTFLMVAPVEEIMKFSVIWRTVFKDPVFDEKIDGVVYAIAAGLGFATFENILAVIGSGENILIARAITATLLHATATGLMGYFLGLAKFKPRQRGWLIAAGLLSAIGVHGLYNFVITLDLELTIPLIIILLTIVYVVLAVGIKKMRRLEA